MPSRYHPIYDGLWNDEKFEALADRPASTFECRGFFAFLCSNHRLRPSGIYRVTDQQIAVDAGLSLKRVVAYMIELEARRLIIRRGQWLFVCGYLARQPRHDNLLAGVASDLKNCTSPSILTAFADRYPMVGQRSPNRRPKVDHPMKLSGTTEQSSTEQYRAEQSSTEQGMVSPNDNGHSEHQVSLAESEQWRREHRSALCAQGLPPFQADTEAGKLVAAEVTYYRKHGQRRPNP